MDYGHWSNFPPGLNPEKAVGFVYLIVNLDTNQKYIGKKFFRGRGKANKGQESNWKTYTSSSKTVNEMIETLGKSRFRFIIIEQYFTLGGLSWAETWSQVQVEVPSNNDEWLNRFIDKVTWKSSESVSKQHKRRLASWIKKFPFPKNQSTTH